MNDHDKQHDGGAQPDSGQGRAHDKGPHKFHIQIDRAHFEVPEPVLTGAQLRQLPQQPIGDDRDLYEIRPGQPDLLIGDADQVTMRDGLRFFTAPKQINPGA